MDDPCAIIVHRGDGAAQPALLRPVSLLRSTPLYNSFLESLDKMQNSDVGRDMIRFFSQECFFKDLLYVDEFGRYSEAPQTVATKMETFFEAVLRRREMYVRELARKKDDRIPPPEWGTAECPAWKHALFNIAFTEDDMRKVMNDWRADRESWMRTETLNKYWAYTRRQDRHN